MVPVNGAALYVVFSTLTVTVPTVVPELYLMSPVEIFLSASIHKGGKSLAEKDGSKGAGWMGTKNDWFVNQGFAAFTYKNGGLKSGDVIRVMFTTNLGEDIGGCTTAMV